MSRVATFCLYARGAAGFTLMELVVVIVIAGIVAAMTTGLITHPMEGYIDLGRRAALVDSTESALRRAARDIRVALPNSVRVTNTASGYALEVLPTLDGGRYQTGTGTATTDLTFAPAPADADFSIAGCFHRFAVPRTSAVDRIAINNLGTTGNDNVYSSTGPAGVITPSGTTINYSVSPAGGTCGVGGAVHHINLNPAYQFKQSSPRSRMFVVQTPVSYLCDAGAGTLTRFAGYAIQAVQPTTAGAFGVAGALVTDQVSACSVTTTTANVQALGLVTLSLTLANQGETVTLIDQVQLDNSR